MKRLRAWTLALFTLLLTMTGALLPYAVSRLQDTYVENRLETRSFDPVSLTLQQGGDVLVRLRNLTGGFDSMLWSGDTKMTPEDVSAAAADAVHTLADAGYIPDFFEEEDREPEYIEPNLVLSTEQAGIPSAVIWICSLPGGAVFIDDESGKMVALESPATNVQEWKYTAPLAESSSSISGLDIKDFTNLASKWTSTLSQYYGMEVSLSGIGSPTDYCVDFLLHFQPQDGQDPCDVTLIFYQNGHITFNL